MTPKTKSELRAERWSALREAGAARFPGVEGRIPNFKGAERAAEHLTYAPAWVRARVVKSNPDSPQRSLRHAALKAGKILYQAVPKLGEAHPFLELDPSRLAAGDLWRASSIQGSAELGRPVALADMRPIDLIVTGCVAVTDRGERLGKGGGYADLEYALLREVGLVDEDTPIATIVHRSQLVPAGTIPMTAHDVALDLVATPEGLIECERSHARPPGVLWDELDPEKQATIPVLAARERPSTDGR